MSPGVVVAKILEQPRCAGVVPRFVKSKYFMQDESPTDDQSSLLGSANTNEIFTATLNVKPILTNQRTMSLRVTCPPFHNPDPNMSNPVVDPYAPARWTQWGKTPVERLAQDRFYYAMDLVKPLLIQGVCPKYIYCSCFLK